MFHFSSIKSVHKNFLRHRAVPLAALVVTTAMTFPVIAAGVEVYQVTDGSATEDISLYQQDAEDALAQSSFGDEEYSIASVISNGDSAYTVNIKKKYDVTVHADGAEYIVHTGDTQVSNILRQAGVEWSEDDRISPSLSSKVTEATDIVVTRVTKAQKTETQAIPFATETRTTDELYTGESRVAQEGIDGVQEITLEYTYYDGVEVSAEQVGTEVIQQPVSKIVENGTKTPTVSTSSGGSVAYSKVLSVTATAYSGGGRTATGTNARVGAIAVDPSVIPLGSRLYITSADGSSWVYGYATAEDTGGAIKGNIIDLYFNSESECNNFGRQSAKVYILS